MKKIDFELRLKNHITAKDIVKIERELEGEDLSCSGFIIDYSSDFLLIQNEIDFQLDGFSIVPTYTVAKIRCNKTDKFHKSILKKERIFEKDYGLTFTVELIDWKTIFKSLKTNNKIVSIEDEANDETYYIIGHIVRVNQKTVSIQYFDSMGQLDGESTKVRYEDITMLNFDNRYINTYSKYLKEPKKT